MTIEKLCKELEHLKGDWKVEIQPYGFRHSLADIKRIGERPGAIILYAGRPGKSCYNCKWHDTDNPKEEAYICVNGRSPYCSEWTDDNDTCSVWEARSEC